MIVVSAVRAGARLMPTRASRHLRDIDVVRPGRGRDQFCKTPYAQTPPSHGYPSARVTAHHNPVAAMAAEHGKIT